MLTKAIKKAQKLTDPVIKGNALAYLEIWETLLKKPKFASFFKKGKFGVVVNLEMSHFHLDWDRKSLYIFELRIEPSLIWWNFGTLVNEDMLIESAGGVCKSPKEFKAVLECLVKLNTPFIKM